jgi:large subunit ribosomal protein L16
MLIRQKKKELKIKMLQPVRTKYRKAFKGRIHGKATRAAVLNYGAYGLKALEPERIIGKQIEAARVALTRYMKRTGRVWTRIFPNIPVSKKPTEVRMGKGKGNIEYYACRVKPGRIIFEVDGVTEEIARIALYKASAKLPIKTKFIKR